MKILAGPLAYPEGFSISNNTTTFLVPVDDQLEVVGGCGGGHGRVVCGLSLGMELKLKQKEGLFHYYTATLK